ncbi:MAG: peptide chain release factor N(5)-glutamine methyltransferase [Planctomycetota bacterium]
MSVAEPLPRLQEILQKTVAYLRERGVDNARRETEWLFCHALDLERLQLYTRYDMLLGPEQLAVLRQLVQRRARREPLAYLLGSQPFCGLELQVDRRVLVPRPETEELVERILADPALPAEEDLAVADIGTGSGAIALALASHRPQWRVHACDRSADALAVAAANAAALRLPVQLHAGDLHAALPSGPWRLLVANLPYISEGERALCDPEIAHEPQEALFADDDGLALIARLVGSAPDLLDEQGVLWLEHGFRHGPRVAELARGAGLQSQLYHDAAGLDRCTRISR